MRWSPKGVISSGTARGTGLTQGRQQGLQAVVVDLMHELQEPADLALRESFARKPGEVVAGQVGDHAALVLAKRHLKADQTFEVFRIHLSGELGGAGEGKRAISAPPS